MDEQLRARELTSAPSPGVRAYSLGAGGGVHMAGGGGGGRSGSAGGESMTLVGPATLSPVRQLPSSAPGYHGLRAETSGPGHHPHYLQLAPSALDVHTAPASPITAPASPTNGLNLVKASLYGLNPPGQTQTRKISITDCADFTSLHQRVVSAFPEVAASKKRVVLSYVDADHDEVQLGPGDDFYDLRRTVEKLHIRFL